ncbi:MAG: menaquinone biosynthetic enzyme MqnA/MqnD family protein [Terriglobales bacterium]
MLTVAAIEFLNAAPLMWGLANDVRFRLDYTLPSACADALAAGAADLGVIPAIELARQPALVGLGAIGVASGAEAGAEVRSILLVSRAGPERIRHLALDAASRTSAAMAQLLLRGRYGAEVATVAASAADWRVSLASADGCLLIGDPALQLRQSGEAAAAGFDVRDLAVEWRAWTGLPFVFALWGIRRPVWAAEQRWLHPRLLAALDEGLSQREALVAHWAPRLQLPPDVVRHYLTANVAYRLTPAHIAGLRRFLSLCAECGLAPAGADALELVEEVTA